MWKSDLNRFLLVFNVRSVVRTRLSLTVPFQTELFTGTYVTVSDIHQSVVNFHTVVSDLHHNVTNTTTVSDIHRISNTHTTVSDIHRNVISNAQTTISGLPNDVTDTHRIMVKGQGETDGKNWSVSVTCTLFMVEPTLIHA